MVIVHISPLECNICAGVAHARIVDVLARTTLLVPDPLQVRRASLSLEDAQRTQEHADGVSATYRVLRAREVVGKVVMRQLCVVGRHCEDFHSLVVEGADGGMYRVLRQVCGIRPRQPDGGLRARRRLGIVVRVLESRAPAYKWVNELPHKH